MINCNQPVKAMTYICDLTLVWIVFKLPQKFEPAVSEGCDRMTTYKDDEGTEVINIHNALRKFLSLIPSLVSADVIEVSKIDWAGELVDVPVPSKLRVLTGFLLREIKDFWRVALLISTLLYSSNINCTQDILSKDLQLDKKRDLFVIVEEAIIKLGLDKAWDVKPLINGREIMNVLQLKAGGPLVREWQQKLLAWQLAHPSGTAEECLDWMKETHLKRAKLE